MTQPILDLEQQPAPYANLIGVDEYSGMLKYEAHFFTCNLMRYREVGSDILERLWYGLQRENIPMTHMPDGMSLEDLSTEVINGQSIVDRCHQWMKNVPILANVDDSVLNELAQSCRHLLFTRHEQVSFSGQEASALYIIASGRLRVPRSALASATTGKNKRDPKLSGDWPPQLLERIKTELTYHVGPVAKVLVQDTAQATHDPHALFHSLGALIPDEKARAKFLASAPAEPSEELLPGAVFGEWTVAVGDAPTPWEGYAAEQTELMVLTSNAFHNVLSKYPDAITAIAKALAHNQENMSEADITQRIRQFHETG
jgi:CRP-like cAMP-binding protein